MSEVPDRVREIIAAANKMSVLATVDEKNAPQMRWMGGLVEDPDKPWTFYLACGASSRKMAQIAANPSAQLMLNKPDYSEVATLSGTAEIVECLEAKKVVWEAMPQIEKYFASHDDPGFGVIRFTTRCMEVLAMAEQHEPYCFELE